MLLLWYQWAILGIVLILSELLIPAFVLVWFGLGALVVAGLEAILLINFSLQLLIWITASVIFVFLWFKTFKPLQHKSLSGRSSAEAVGEVGILVSDIEPFHNAKVRFQRPLIGSDIWECLADEKLKAGTRVRVVSVEGSFLKIAQEKQG